MAIGQCRRLRAWNASGTPARFRCARRLRAARLNSHQRSMVHGTAMDRMAARIEHAMFRCGRSIQAMVGGRMSSGFHSLAPCVSDLREKMTMPRSGSAPVSSSATADTRVGAEDYDAHLKARRRLRECLASGDETQ